MDGVARAMARWLGDGAARRVERGNRTARRLGLGEAPLVLVGLVLAAVGCESGSPRAVPGEGAASAASSSGAGSSGAGTPAPGAAAPAASVAAGTVNHYGAALEPASPVPLATLLENPKAYATQTVTTEGKVQRACSRKGCWMEIGEGDDACRVTFKDYAFFVPTDSAGSHAKIQGKLDTREVEAAAVAHLESEGARFKHKNADGSATEVRMIASAVELRR